MARLGFNEYADWFELVFGLAGLFNSTMSTAAPDPDHASHSAVISGRPGEEFFVGGYRAFLLRPANTDPNRKEPWVWYAPTLPGLPAAEEAWMFERFLAAGIAIAGVDVGESFGSPGGRAGFSALYRYCPTKGVVRFHKRLFNSKLNTKGLVTHLNRDAK